MPDALPPRCRGERRGRQCGLAHHFEEFDLEGQRGVGRNHVAATAFTVSDVRRAGEQGLAAFTHFGDAFGPARNHAVEREGGGLAALVRAVEFGAVGQGATVMHLHGGGRVGLLALAVLERLINQPGRQGFRRSGVGSRGGEDGDGQQRKSGVFQQHGVSCLTVEKAAIIHDSPASG